MTGKNTGFYPGCNIPEDRKCLVIDDKDLSSPSGNGEQADRVAGSLESYWFFPIPGVDDGDAAISMSAGDRGPPRSRGKAGDGRVVEG
jgi:hypothetical protein